VALNSNSDLLQQLIGSPATDLLGADSSAGNSSASNSSIKSVSPALLTLNRWVRGIGKQLAIGLVSMLVLLNVAADVPQVAQAHSVTGDRPLAARSLRSPQTNSGATVNGHAAKSTHAGYLGLNAHMTHHHITRSRLSIPYEANRRRGDAVEIAEAR